MVFALAAAALALISFLIMCWQFLGAIRFPLELPGREHESPIAQPPPGPPPPGFSLLKPLKGVDEETADCLRSWFQQRYEGEFEILFGVADANDPAVALVSDLQRAFPNVPSRLIHCHDQPGPNAKVCSLIRLTREARFPLLCLSDADVWAPESSLRRLYRALQEPGTGLANCLYRQAPAKTGAMQLESIAINADFWSQVLQARAIGPLDFALGAVIALRSSDLRQIGGFEALADFLADDFLLGRRIHRSGLRVQLVPTVVECRSKPLGWNDVWSHQLRWARTIRVCQPVAYFLSILGNPTPWALLLMAVPRSAQGTLAGGIILAVRLLTSAALRAKMEGKYPSPLAAASVWLKDLVHAVMWALSFLGNRVVWRGRTFRVSSDGRLTPIPTRGPSETADGT